MFRQLMHSVTTELKKIIPAPSIPGGLLVNQVIRHAAAALRRVVRQAWVLKMADDVPKAIRVQHRVLITEQAITVVLMSGIALAIIVRIMAIVLTLAIALEIIVRIPASVLEMGIIIARIMVSVLMRAIVPETVVRIPAFVLVELIVQTMDCVQEVIQPRVRQ